MACFDIPTIEDGIFLPRQDQYIYINLSPHPIPPKNKQQYGNPTVKTYHLPIKFYL